MKFGPVPIDKAEGAILAHSLAAGGKKIRKAQVLSAEDVALLREAGVRDVIAAVLDAGDVEENAAAEQIVAALRFSGVDARTAATGRVNLHAISAGIFTVDAALIDAINAVDPAITVATLAHNAAVEDHQMVATVKIIPYAVPGAVLAKVVALASARPVFDVHPFRTAKVGIVQTTLAGLKDSVLDKTVRTTEARLARSGSSVGSEKRVAHRTEDVAAAAAELAKNA